MEFILTFLLIFAGVVWIFGRLFPRILAWYIKRRINKMGGSGTSSGSFGNNGFAGFWSSEGFGRMRDTGEGYGMKEEQVRKSKEQEGKVTVTEIEYKEKVIERDMGEYVEYEEKTDSK